MIRSQEPSGCRRNTCTRTPVLSADRVEVSARFSNRRVGRGASKPKVDFTVPVFADFLLERHPIGGFDDE